MWQQLIKTVNRLIDEYERLLVLGQKKRAILIAVDFKSLEAILKEEQNVVASIAKCEEARQAVLKRLSSGCGNISSATKMTDLYHVCPPNLAAELKDCNGRLSQIVQKNTEASEANKFLISAALTAVEYHLNIIGGTKASPVYGATGSEQFSKSKKFDFEA
jgi:flagellar biosynthesis/type III secretory pathway chaperone